MTLIVCDHNKAPEANEKLGSKSILDLVLA